MFKWSRYRQD